MLCSIAGVCMRFKEIAKQVFTLKYKNKEIDIFNDLKCHEQSDMRKIPSFLYTFGSLIESLHIDTLAPDKIDSHHQRSSLCSSQFLDRYKRLSYSSHFLKTINKYCKNLISLHIYMFKWDNRQLIEIQPLLSRLKKLSIAGYDCRLTSDFFSTCSELESLKVIANKSENAPLPEITFPKLIELKYKIGHEYEAKLEPFLACNPQIRKLELNFLTNDLCHFIGQNMLNLRELTVNESLPGSAYRRDVHFDQLNHMEGLKIRLESYRASLRCLNNVSVEYIRLIRDLDRDTLNKISRIDIKTLKIRMTVDFVIPNIHLIELAQNLRNLEVLEIDSSMNDNYMVKIEVLKQMLPHASQLTELTFRSKSPDFVLFNENDYYELLRIVNRRTNLNKLTIKIQHWRRTSVADGNSVSSKYKILKMAPNWLILEQTDNYYWNNSNIVEPSLHRAGMFLRW